MKPGSIIMLVFGTLFTLIGLGLASGGALVLVANSQQQDNGYFTTPTETFSVDSYALTSPRLDAINDRDQPGSLPVDVGSLRLDATSTETGREVFIGIASQADVDRYLANVRHTEISDVRFAPFSADYRTVSGTDEPAVPGDEAFWTVSASGSGTQSIEWDIVTSGQWAVVIMNADAAPAVSVDLQAGYRSDLIANLLGPLAGGLLAGGAALFLVGLALVVAGAIGLGRNGPPPSREPAAVTGSTGGPGAMAAPAPAPRGDAEMRAYPARLHGRIDADLSRALWLVKWFLAIPHAIVLAFLWIAFFITTIVAGFAILFTGTYPRALFNFNVGVLRWNWRVAFYAFSALGTDRYPPFTLAPTDYPADAEVEYPERLSHGLVLVKWWLLALPQLLVVGAITGSTTWLTVRPDDWNTTEGWRSDAWQGAGISLLGLLVFIAAVILLFTGRYQRPLFDLIMGLNRWTFRVTVYVALMRDEYPPFRLDQGPSDPAIDTARILPAADRQ